MDLRIPDVGLSTSLPRAILVHFVRDIMVGLSRLPSPLPSPNGRGVDAALDNDDSIFIGVNSLSLWDQGQGRGRRTWITITVKMLRLRAEKGSIAPRRRNWFMRHTMRIVGTYSPIILRDAAM